MRVVAQVAIAPTVSGLARALLSRGRIPCKAWFNPNSSYSVIQVAQTKAEKKKNNVRAPAASGADLVDEMSGNKHVTPLLAIREN